MLTSTPGGTQAIGSGRAEVGRSSPVKTAYDAVARQRPPSVSIETIFACASGERTNAAHSCPGSVMSST